MGWAQLLVALFAGDNQHAWVVVASVVAMVVALAIVAAYLFFCFFFFRNLEHNTLMSRSARRIVAWLLDRSSCSNLAARLCLGRGCLMPPNNVDLLI